MLLKAIEDFQQLKRETDRTVDILKKNNNFSLNFKNKIITEFNLLTAQFISPMPQNLTDVNLSLFRKSLDILRAKIYKHLYKEALIYFVANPMDALLQEDMYFVKIDKQEPIRFDLWQSEYESAAINIINCSEGPLEIFVSISPLMSSDGMQTESKDSVTIRRAIFVKAMGYGLTADALVLQNEKSFTLDPGHITQIWLTVYNPGLGTGNYKSALAISASGPSMNLSVNTIPVNIEIGRIIFPKKVALNTCTWDMYPFLNAVSPKILPFVSKDLESHYVNVSLATS